MEHDLSLAVGSALLTSFLNSDSQPPTGTPQHTKITRPPTPHPEACWSVIDKVRPLASYQMQILYVLGQRPSSEVCMVEVLDFDAYYHLVVQKWKVSIDDDDDKYLVPKKRHSR